MYIYLYFSNYLTTMSTQISFYFWFIKIVNILFEKSGKYVDKYFLHIVEREKGNMVQTREPEHYTYIYCDINPKTYTLNRDIFISCFSRVRIYHSVIIKRITRSLYIYNLKDFRCPEMRIQDIICSYHYKCSGDMYCSSTHVYTK